MLRVRGTVRRVVSTVGAVGVAAAALLAAANCSGSATSVTPAELKDSACETAVPAAPDFAAQPFAFDPVVRAKAFVQALADEDFKSAYEMLAPELMSIDSLCEIPLETLWPQLILGLDEHESASGGRVSIDIAAPPVFLPVTDTLIVWLRISYARGDRLPDIEVQLGIHLVRDGRVYLFTPDLGLRELGPVGEYPRPLYADTTLFEEFDVSFGEAPWVVGGTLTVPRGPGPFPAVVVVQGLQRRPDRDGTFGATKWIRDLAWGLASRGIATLRYDQRAWTHAQAFARQAAFTIDEELAQDALAAVALVRRTPRIDSTRVYVLGESLAGLAAPRIARQVPDLAGLIIASAPSGTYFESTLRTREQAAEEGAVRQRSVEQRRARAASISALAAGEMAALDMSLRPSYHLDLATYRPEEAARGLRMPMLILHGEANLLPTMADRVGWLQSLGGRPDAAFRWYANHRMLFDVSELTGSAIRPQGHVSAAVINDIAAWIGGIGLAVPCMDVGFLRSGCRGGPDTAVPTDAQR